MVGISNSLAVSVPQSSSTVATQSSTLQNIAESSSSGSGSTFGPATNIDLSPAAQAILAAQSSGSGTSASQSSASGTAPVSAKTTTSPSSASGNSAASTPSGSGSGRSTSTSAHAHRKGGGGGGTAATYSSSGSGSSLVELNIQKLAPQIGLVAAKEVVDNQGDIDETLLAQIIAQQQSAVTVTLSR